MNSIPSKLFPHAVVAVAALLLSACATSEPPGTTVALLGGAGFRLRTPDTPKQKEVFATLPASRISSIVVNGRKFYVYKDATRGLALVGGEAEYQRYRQMAQQEQASAGYERAMMANAADAAGWRGAAGYDWWR